MERGAPDPEREGLSAETDDPGRAALARPATDERVRRAALAAYDDARIRGLCEEGAYEVAADELRAAAARRSRAERQATMVLKLKRVYEPPSEEDGCRVLVDRVWPRGLRKEQAKVDLWLKEIAPSDELRKWFGHDPQKWAAFKRRYHAELDQNREAVNPLLERTESGPVTLLFAARDEEHNNAVALKEYLENRG